MRIKRLKSRSAAIIAVAVAGALAVAGIAMAAATSTAVLSFNPSSLPPPGSGYTNGKLNVHTHTNYTNPGNANPGGATERAQLYFDDDIKVNTNAVPKCAPGDVSGNITMKAAMAACGSSLVSVSPSTAQASANGAFTINGCVLVFNGRGSASEILLFTRVQVSNPSTISCANPSSNEQGNTTVLLKGDLKANPSSVPGDFRDGDNCSPPSRIGCQLDVNNITAAAAFPLTDFNANVRKGGFVAARCDDTPKQLNLRTKFTYNGGPGNPQTVNDSFTCT
jgi:hypothetical protein